MWEGVWEGESECGRERVSVRESGRESEYGRE